MLFNAWHCLHNALSRASSFILNNTYSMLFVYVIRIEICHFWSVILNKYCNSVNMAFDITAINAGHLLHCSMRDDTETARTSASLVILLSSFIHSFILRSYIALFQETTHFHP